MLLVYCMRKDCKKWDECRYKYEFLCKFCGFYAKRKDDNVKNKEENR